MEKERLAFFLLVTQHGVKNCPVIRGRESLGSGPNNWEGRAKIGNSLSKYRDREFLKVSNLKGAGNVGQNGPSYRTKLRHAGGRPGLQRNTLRVQISEPRRLRI